MGLIKNRWIILVCILILFTMIGASVFILKFKPKIPGVKSDIKPKLVNTTNVANLATREHPKLYVARLELDPKTNTITQLSTSKANGDPPNLYTTQPKETGSEIIFKIEVSSDKNQLISSGWNLVYKDLALTSKGTFVFTITTSYQQNNLISVYSKEGKLLWIGKIP